ncbi:unnamed protein product [Rotaria sp. Silwood1]|nr:unnamed protein product [Rotaria sp. Silwood1]CAF1057593.1 unnamed protein product [Rotaria sp. Silwood1]CAF1102483.1 unnamed protein product [Rotaria sp. Silwood1]CAF3403485.1 unnamed protein product [Rotaria sp. Silwood1]CAF3416320.1 unnamed protein product [Rotaria sp. Silwood1]
MRWWARGGQFTDIQSVDLEGQTFLITGAAGGIGKETAIELAKRGARVILFARRGNLAEAVADVQKSARSSANVVGYILDLSDLQSIKSCVEEFMKNEDPNRTITALINNAGVMACPYSKTKDGFELQMGTNHFGHFYFTKLLLPRLNSSRIVNVSSLGHALWQVPCDAAHYTQMCNPNTYQRWSAYSLSKSANILFTRELQRRFNASHKICSYSVHPGGVNTPLDRHISVSTNIRTLAKPIRYLLFKTPLEGAQTNLYCALSDDAKPGAYHADCQPIPVANKYVENDEIASAWWDYSEKVINEKLKDIEDK